MRWNLVYEYLFGRAGAPVRRGSELLPADVFTFIQSIIQDPFARAMDGILTALNREMATIVTVLMLIALAVSSTVWACGGINGRGENPLWTAVKMAVPWWLTVNVAAFYEWVVAFGLYVLPAALANAVGGSLGGGRVRLDAEAFGGVLNDVMLMAADLFRAAGLNPVYFFLVVVLVLAAGIAVGYAWWVWFKAGLFLIMLFAVSPIPVLCLITPWTRFVFMRWLDSVVGFVWLKLLSVVFISLLLAVESQIASIVMSDRSSIADKVGLIFCAILVFVAMIFAAVDIPRIAGSLSGGAVTHTSYGAYAFAAGWTTRAWKGFRDRQRRPQPANP